MPLAASSPDVAKGVTSAEVWSGVVEPADDPAGRVTVPDDWPGAAEFAELGRLVQKIEVQGVVTQGIFRPTDGGAAVYAASCRPHVVGMGIGQSEAINDWLVELFHKWEMARTLKPPYPAAVENDIDAMRRIVTLV